MAVSLHQLLKTMTEMGGTDLHITTNSPPQIRVDGKLRPLDLPRSRRSRPSSSPTACSPTPRSIASRRTSSSTSASGSRASRASASNVFMQRGAVGAVYRTIPYEIRNFKELGLPPVIATICRAGGDVVPGRELRAKAKRRPPRRARGDTGPGGDRRAAGLPGTGVADQRVPDGPAEDLLRDDHAWDDDHHVRRRRRCRGNGRRERCNRSDGPRGSQRLRRRDLADAPGLQRRQSRRPARVPHGAQGATGRAQGSPGARVPHRSPAIRAARGGGRGGMREGHLHPQRGA